MKTLKFHLRQTWEKLQYIFRFFCPRQSFGNLSGIYNDVIQAPGYLVKANPWGAFKIPHKYRSQFQTRIHEQGWAFATPRRNYGVIGYPSITFHNQGERIAHITHHLVSYAVRLQMERCRKYNLSFDLWIGTAPIFDWPTIVHEVMVWEDYRVAMPFGKYVETVQLGGNEYRVYTGYIDKSGEELGIDGWRYTAFLRVARTRSNTLMLTQVLRYLLDRKMIRLDHYLLRSELGTEVYNANGALELLKFETEYKTR